MPANLTPQYYEAEKKYRAAKEPADKLEALEEMLAVMPKHKGTDHMKADIRRKIAKLNQSFGKKLATQRATMLIEKVGAAQIAVIGPPNSGKSQLVASLTSASPTVADYPFTTQQPLPGMMVFEDIQIQLIDTPPITEQAIEWWMPHLIRRADAALALVDLSENPVEQMEMLITQLIGKKIGLGIKRNNNEEENIYWQKTLIIGNKVNAENAQQRFMALENKYKETFPTIAVSAKESRNLDNLKLRIYQLLDMIRVYTKAPGQKADYSDPIVLDRGSTVEDAAASVHKDFLAGLKFARIWGSGKHDGLRVKRNHVLQDGDIIEIHT